MEQARLFPMHQLTTTLEAVLEIQVKPGAAVPHSQLLLLELVAAKIL